MEEFETIMANVEFLHFGDCRMEDQLADSDSCTGDGTLNWLDSCFGMRDYLNCLKEFSRKDLMQP